MPRRRRASLTATSNHQRVSEAKAVGAVACLFKDADLSDLIDYVRQVVRAPQLGRRFPCSGPVPVGQTEPQADHDRQPRPGSRGGGDSADRDPVINAAAALGEMPGGDEAAFDVGTLDYDFHMFTDADTGRDPVVYRAGPPGYRMACTAAFLS
jgi:hypothetical protein